MKKSIFTPEQKRLRQLEASRRWKQRNKVRVREYEKRYKRENREHIYARNKQWRKTVGLSEVAKQHKKEYDSRRQAGLKQQAVELLGGKCVECGSTERLQFDHIRRDRTDSKHIITYMLISTTWENVLKELKKCQLLCQPCHAKKSHAERGRTGIYNHGTANRYRILGCRCELCSGYHKAYMKEWHRKRKLQIASIR